MGLTRDLKKRGPSQGAVSHNLILLQLMEQVVWDSLHFTPFLLSVAPVSQAEMEIVVKRH